MNIPAPAPMPAPSMPAAASAGAPTAVSQAPASKGAQYYKDVGIAQKELKSVVKELKVNKCELALEHLSAALKLLTKYSS